MSGLDPATVYAVVVDFAAYPRLFPELKQVAVLSTTGGRVRAEFRGAMVIPFRYVLDLDCDPERMTVDWRYVEGEVVKNSEGGWRFSAESGGARVSYRVGMEIAAPLPAFVMKKITDGLISLSLPAMLASVEREARARTTSATRSSGEKSPGLR
jgi:ribosome-associated toxin RatA of RatAB toxin-antitoxin module